MIRTNHQHITGEEIVKFKAIAEDNEDFALIEFSENFIERFKNCDICKKRYRFFDFLGDMIGADAHAPALSADEKQSTIATELKGFVDFLERLRDSARDFITDTFTIRYTALAHEFRGGTDNDEIDEEQEFLIAIKKGADYFEFDLNMPCAIEISIPVESFAGHSTALFLYHETKGAMGSYSDWDYTLDMKSKALYTEELPPGKYFGVIAKIG